MRWNVGHLPPGHAHQSDLAQLTNDLAGIQDRGLMAGTIDGDRHLLRDRRIFERHLGVRSSSAGGFDLGAAKIVRLDHTDLIAVDTEEMGGADADRSGPVMIT